MILLSTLRGGTGAFFPLLFIALSDLISGDFKRALLIIVGGTLASMLALAVYHSLSWAFFSYRYENGYLYIKSGILIKNNRSIKKERVQTVNISTGILQRLAGVATVQVETAGGGHESELKLVAVTMEDARQLKNVLEQQTEKTENVIDVDDDKKESASNLNADDLQPVNQYQISISELFLAGASSGGFLLLFSFLGAAFLQLYTYIPERYLDYLNLDYLLEHAASFSVIITIAAVVLTLLVLSWLISTAAFMVKYANFRLNRLKENLQISWGLIERKQVALKTHRLQAITVEEGILRQPFGLASITAEVAGGGTKDQEYVMMIYLLMKQTKIQDFMGLILPEYKLPQALNPLPRRSLRRYIFRALLFTLLPVIPLQFFPYGWLSLILFIPATVLGILRYRAGATCLESNLLSLRFRNLNRYQISIKRNHIQSLTISSNPFQRRANLCTLNVSVLSSPAGKTFSLADVDVDECKKIWRWYSRCNFTHCL